MTRHTKAFSLLELLVSIAIIMVLVGLVAVSLRGVKASAGRTKSLNALKQMALAYSSYADDHRKRLMPGYIGANLLGPGQVFENLTAELPDGTPLNQCAGNICDAGSYVWRLAQYVDDTWQTFFTDTADPGLLSELQAEYDSGVYGPGTAGVNDIGISERPAYGMNSIFVGGDSAHGGAYAVDRNPWTGSQEKIAATRLSEVKNPSRLIVFAPTAKAATSGNDVFDDPSLGFCELRPPYVMLSGSGPAGRWLEPQWTVGEFGLVEKTPTGEYANGAGLPIARGGKDLMPVGHLDGSATVEQISNLSRDMRRWNPFEIGLRKTQDPPP